ncbi:hypothetical protein GCM10009743_37050 [Kribbella swartbergensis]
MESADWLNGGFDSTQARFLMITAITHHRFSSPTWGEDEVRKLHAELTDIELSSLGLVAALRGRAAAGPANA